MTRRSTSGAGSGGSEVRVLERPEAVAREAAATLERLVAALPDRGGVASVALSGGATPRRLFEILAAEYRARIDWKRLEIFFGDERAVPPDHADSNYRMAREFLLDHVPVAPERIHPMPAADPDLEAAAGRYARTLEERLPRSAGGVPVLDLVWLGLGEDGHTASLFPGSGALDERRRWVVASDGPQPGSRRLTLTFPVLDAARHIQFLVTGERKAATVARVLARSPRPVSAAPLPAARVRPAAGTLEWLLDAAAAGALR